MRSPISFVGCLLIGLTTLAASAQEPASSAGALISEALAKPVQMELDTTLPQALRSISEKTGVRLEADRSVWEALPWGEQTRISAKIGNQTLGGALTAITRKLGLEFAVRNNAVELRPAGPLRRLGRRATTEELAALDLLQSTPAAPAESKTTVGALVEAVDQKLLAAKSLYAVEFRPGDAAKPEQAVAIPRNATLADALECLTTQTGLTWYPWGQNVVVVPKVDQVRNQLQRTITVRYNNVDVGQVLAELSQQSGVDFDIEPGAVQRIPPQFRSVRLTLENRSVRQALEDISGFTALEYEVTPSGVTITNPRPASAGGVVTTPQDPVVGWITLPDGFQLMLRESQVPPDVRAYLKFRTQKEVDALRERMKSENFIPPATQPTAPQDL